MGAPSTPPQDDQRSPGQRGSCPRAAPGERRSARRPPGRVAASSRPSTSALARHTSRTAISANPTGSTSWATHVGMPAPSDRADLALRRAPARRAPAPGPPTPPRRPPRRTRRARAAPAPSGISVPVASDSSLPSRAAIAAPRNPTQSDEVLNDRAGAGNADAEQRGAATISSSGRTAIAASASAATASSRRASDAAHLGGAPARLRAGGTRRALSRRDRRCQAAPSRRASSARGRSASCRHSGPVALVTLRPCCCISVTASASCFGTSACSCFSTASGDLGHLGAIGAGECRPRSVLAMTVAPTSGPARCRACRASACTTGTPSPRSGGVGSASIMPVVSPVRMSVIAIARGWKPFALYHCVMRSSPAEV